MNENISDDEIDVIPKKRKIVKKKFKKPKFVVTQMITKIDKHNGNEFKDKTKFNRITNEGKRFKNNIINVQQNVVINDYKEKDDDDDDDDDVIENYEIKNQNDDDDSGAESDENNGIKRKRKKKFKEPNEKTQRTVFVGNLPLTLTISKFRQIFQKYGPIKSVRFRGAIPKKLHMPKKGAIIKKEFSPIQNSVIGYVVFKSKDDAIKALEMNGTEIEGHYIRVDNSKSSPDNSCSVFIGNLPFKTNEDELRSFFSECGDIESIRIVRDSTTGKSKGFGFVTFKSKDSVVLALEMNEREFKERKVRIVNATNDAKKSKKPMVKHPKTDDKHNGKTTDSRMTKNYRGETANKKMSLKAKKNKKKLYKKHKITKTQKKIAEILSH